MLVLHKSLTELLGLFCYYPSGLFQAHSEGGAHICGRVCGSVFTRARMCTHNAIFMTNSAATCLFSERLRNKNKDRGRQGNQRSPDICICHSAWLALCPPLCEFPKHFEVNKLLIFSISTDDSMVRSGGKQNGEGGFLTESVFGRWSCQFSSSFNAFVHMARS